MYNNHKRNTIDKACLQAVGGNAFMANNVGRPPGGNRDQRIELDGWNRESVFFHVTYLLYCTYLPLHAHTMR